MRESSGLHSELNDQPFERPPPRASLPPDGLGRRARALVGRSHATRRTPRLSPSALDGLFFVPGTSPCSESHYQTKEDFPTTPATCSTRPASRFALAVTGLYQPHWAASSRQSSSGPRTYRNSSPTELPMQESPDSTSHLKQNGISHRFSISNSGVAVSSWPRARMLRFNLWLTFRQMHESLRS